jgi:DNA-binding XRE family transcriptional regulator
VLDAIGPEWYFLRSQGFRFELMVVLSIRLSDAVNRNSIDWGKLVLVRQVKAARALLGWSQSELAEKAGVSEPTIARLESLDGELGGRAATAEKILGAIKGSGIEFIDENGGGLGIRFRKPRKRK